MLFSVWKDCVSDFLESIRMHGLRLPYACICNPSHYVPVTFLKLHCLKKKKKSIEQINHLWHFKETTKKMMDLKKVLLKRSVVKIKILCLFCLLVSNKCISD